MHSRRPCHPFASSWVLKLDGAIALATHCRTQGGPPLANLESGLVLTAEARRLGSAGGLLLGSRLGCRRLLLRLLLRLNLCQRLQRGAKAPIAKPSQHKVPLPTKQSRQACGWQLP